MEPQCSGPEPLRVASLLDTDLCNLTMQCAILKYFPDVEVTYELINRTPGKLFSRAAYRWLQEQINNLGVLRVREDELQFLKDSCPFLHQPYLEFLSDLHLDPSTEVVLTFHPEGGDDGGGDMGTLRMSVKGPWVKTISYEVPLLALTCEAYFRFMDNDWTHDGQEDLAYNKGLKLLESGCIFAEYGTRRRRDLHTHVLVLRGLVRAKERAELARWPGRLSGTSNVRLAMDFGLRPMGTVGHQWFMGIAALTGDYSTCTQTALSLWLGCFGEGIWKVAPTDTFGTQAFLRSFRKPLQTLSLSGNSIGAGHTLDFSNTKDQSAEGVGGGTTFAQAFSGVRQDSGDPVSFVKTMRRFYDDAGITERKSLVFSDSLTVDRCLQYKSICEEAGFDSAFGVGTSFTNDFESASGRRSAPLNVVMKLTSAGGKPAIKIGDTVGKCSGDRDTLDRVMAELHHQYMDWAEGDESTRWEKVGNAHSDQSHS